MKNISTKEIVMSGLLLATGIIVPMVFHSFGIAGPVFLPMHIPVLIGGLLLSPMTALFLGFLTPLLSSSLTGMPVLFPIGIIMMFELATYGFVASWMYSKMGKHMALSLIVAMIMGRIVAGLIVFLMAILFGINIKPLTYVYTAVLTGIPGILLQLVLVPAIIVAIKKREEMRL